MKSGIYRNVVGYAKQRLLHTFLFTFLFVFLFFLDVINSENSL